MMTSSPLRLDKKKALMMSCWLLFAMPDVAPSHAIEIIARLQKGAVAQQGANGAPAYAVWRNNVCMVRVHECTVNECTVNGSSTVHECMVNAPSTVHDVCTSEVQCMVYE
jgi:hypothetical protein